MQARLANTAADKVEGDAVILPLFEGEKTLPAEAAALDKKLKGSISELLKGDGFKGKFMELVPVHNQASVPSTWTVLMGVGKREHLDMVRLRNALAGRRSHAPQARQPPNRGRGSQRRRAAGDRS